LLLAQFSPCVGFAIETFSNFQPAFLGGGMSVIPDGFIRGLNWKDELEQMDKMRTKGICDSEIQKRQVLKRILLNGNPATDEFTIRIRKKNKSPLLFFKKSQPSESSSNLRDFYFFLVQSRIDVTFHFFFPILRKIKIPEK
jgi:hypothetical protein